MNEQLLPSFQRIYNIMRELREKCPWDKEQTKESIRHLTIEETYELSEAILKNDMQELKVEVGDVFMHMLFYCSLAEDAGAFSTQEMMDSLSEKLIRRHPHIYGDVQANTSEQVKLNWEEIKMKEAGAEGGKRKKKGVLSGVPDGLPSLIKAMRIQEKVSNVGFDWDNRDQVWAKVQEELSEFHAEAEALAGQEGSKEKMEKEFGDVLFSLVNYARFIGVNPEDALEKTNLKFRRRFDFLEERVNEQGRNLKEMTLAEMDEVWDEAKKTFR
jgi:XTP/dITP diphosphohydrolase